MQNTNKETEINLVGEFDARVWASEFVRIVKENPNIALDEGTMIGWFANAIMAGYDHANRRNNELDEELNW